MKITLIKLEIFKEMQSQNRNKPYLKTCQIIFSKAFNLILSLKNALPPTHVLDR